MRHSKKAVRKDLRGVYDYNISNTKSIFNQIVFFVDSCMMKLESKSQREFDYNKQWDIEVNINENITYTLIPKTKRAKNHVELLKADLIKTELQDSGVEP